MVPLVLHDTERMRVWRWYMAGLEGVGEEQMESEFLPMAILDCLRVHLPRG